MSRYFGMPKKKSAPSRKRSKLDEEGEEDEPEIGEPSQVELPDIFGGAADTNVYKLDNHIHFTGEVNEKSVNRLQKLIYAANREYKILEGTLGTCVLKPRPIYLHITSMGGELMEGFRAVDIIENSYIPVFTIVEGYAVSSATLIFLAGKRRYMSKNSYMLIHQLSGGAVGKFEEIQDNHTNDNTLMEHLYNFYVKKTEGKLSKKKLKDIMKHDIYWNFDTCKSMSLVEGVYEHDTIRKYEENLEKKIRDLE